MNKNKTLKCILAVCAVFMHACGNFQNLSHIKDIKEHSEDSFFTLSQSERLEILQSMDDAIQKRYTFIDFKKSNGLNWTTNVARAIEFEKNISDSTSLLLKAQDALDFSDRMMRLVASMQDSHLTLQNTLPRPTIMNGIFLHYTPKKVYIVGKLPRILAYNSLNARASQDYEKLEVGDTIEEINGEPVKKAIEDLMPYISGSSERFVTQEATEALSIRNFKYPRMPYADFCIFSQKLKRIIKVRLPFYYLIGSAQPRKETKYYLTAKGFKTLNNLGITWDTTSHKWHYMGKMEIKTYNHYALPSFFENVEEWFPNKETKETALETPIVRFAYITKNDKKYAVLQILSYDTENLINPNSNLLKEKISLQTLLRYLIKRVKSDKVPLILDLRSNAGGLTRLPKFILSLLSPPGAQYPNIRAAFRITPVWRQLIESENNFDTLPSFNAYSFIDTSINELKRSLDSNHNYTAFYGDLQNITADEEVGGFENPTVALISPNCVSSCDIQAALFKHSKRVTLIGTHTNGAGGGFVTDENVFPPWHDNYGLFAIKNIPLIMMGIPTPNPSKEWADDPKLNEHHLENHPTPADVPYDDNAIDFTTDGSGWFEKAIQTLDAKQKSSKK